MVCYGERMDIVNDLQEAPSGKPWERDWIRDWEPGPFDAAEYERIAAHAAAMFQFAGSFFIEVAPPVDPLLSRRKEVRDRWRRHGPTSTRRSR